jgi:hypothetical protein
LESSNWTSLTGLLTLLDISVLRRDTCKIVTAAAVYMQMQAACHSVAWATWPSTPHTIEHSRARPFPGRFERHDIFY